MRSFPNGFNSWVETHFEVVSHIIRTADLDGSAAYNRNYTNGTGGLYELAEEWTDEFESRNQGRQWNGDFFDCIEEFLSAKDQ